MKLRGDRTEVPQIFGIGFFVFPKGREKRPKVRAHKFITHHHHKTYKFLIQTSRSLSKMKFQTNYPFPSNVTSAVKVKLLQEKKNNGEKTFPCMLYQMLEDAPKLKFDDIVSWLPNGNGFKDQCHQG